MWVRESSLSPDWIGHNEKHGFQILRSVPRGNPKRIVRRDLDLDAFIDIEKTYEVMTAAQKEEWSKMKEAAGLNPERINLLLDEDRDGFDWAKPLIEVQYLFIIFFLEILFL